MPRQPTGRPRGRPPGSTKFSLVNLVRAKKLAGTAPLDAILLKMGYWIGEAEREIREVNAVIRAGWKAWISELPKDQQKGEKSIIEMGATVLFVREVERRKGLVAKALDKMAEAADKAAPYCHASIKAQMNVPLSDAAKIAAAKDARAALARLVDQGATAGSPGGDPSRLN